MLRTAIPTVLLTAALSTASAPAQAASWTNCDAYTTQPQAQAAWIADGRKHIVYR